MALLIEWKVGQLIFMIHNFKSSLELFINNKYLILLSNIDNLFLMKDYKTEFEEKD